MQTGTELEEGARSKQNRFRLAAPRRTVADECSWSYWRTAGTPGRHCLLRRSWPQETFVPLSWYSHRATSDLLEECRFLFNTQLMFLKKEKDPTSKQVDDNEWIRSLAEAQEVTTHISGR